MTRPRRNRTTISLLAVAAMLIVAGFAFWMLVTLQPAGFIAPGWANTAFLILSGLGVVIGAVGALYSDIILPTIDRLRPEGNTNLASQIYSKAPIRPVTYDTLVRTLGLSGQIPWIDRNLTTPSLFGHHDCVAIVGVMKSGKSREAYELARRTVEQGIVGTIYEPTSSLDLIAVDDLSAAIQLHLDSVPALLIIDELDLRQSDDQLQRLSVCMETITARRPDTRYIVTLQYERLTSHLEQWLSSHSFHSVSVPSLSPAERHRMVFDGAITLQANIAPSALDMLAASPTITRPWDAIRLLQAAPKTTSADPALDEHAVKVLATRAEADLWAEQRANVFKMHPLAQPLLDSIVTFLSAGVTARVSTVHRYAIWQIEQGRYSATLLEKIQKLSKRRGRMEISLHQAAVPWAVYDIVAVEGRYVMPEPRLLPILLEPDAARKCLLTFAIENPRGRLETLGHLINAIAEKLYRTSVPRYYTRSARRIQTIVYRTIGRSRIAGILGIFSYPVRSFLWLNVLISDLLFASSGERAMILLELNAPAKSHYLAADFMAQSGITAAQFGNYSQAMKFLENAVAHNPDAPLTLAWCGAVRRCLGDLHGALDDLSRALELDPRNDFAMGERGYVHMLMGNYERSLADLDAALTLYPLSEWKLTLRGIVHDLMGSFELALKDFNRAIERDPKDHFAIAGRGRAYRRMGVANKALIDLRRATQLAHGNHWHWFQRHLVELQAEMHPEANASLDTAIRLATKSERVSIELGADALCLMLYHIAAYDELGAQRYLAMATDNSLTRFTVAQSLYDIADYLAVVPDNQLALQMRQQLELYGEHISLVSAQSIVTRPVAQKDPTS